MLETSADRSVISSRRRKRVRQVLIRQGGRQVIAGHWAGVVPQKAIKAAQGESVDMAEVVVRDSARRSSLAQPLSDDAAVVAEVG